MVLPGCFLCRRQTVILSHHHSYADVVAYWLLELISALSLKSFKISARHPHIHKLLFWLFSFAFPAFFFCFPLHHCSAATPEVLIIASLLFRLLCSHHSFQSAETRAQKRQHPGFFYLLSDTTILVSILYLLYPILILKPFPVLNTRQLSVTIYI